MKELVIFYSLVFSLYLSVLFFSYKKEFNKAVNEFFIQRNNFLKIDTREEKISFEISQRIEIVRKKANQCYRKSKTIFLIGIGGIFSIFFLPFSFYLGQYFFIPLLCYQSFSLVKMKIQREDLESDYQYMSNFISKELFQKTI